MLKSSLQDPPQVVCSQRKGLSWAASLGCWKERPSPVHLSHRLLSHPVLACLLSPCRIFWGPREQRSASTQHWLVLPSSLKCETMGTEYVISFLESLHVPAEPHLNVSLFLFPQANGILGTTVLITPISAVRILLKFVPWEPENKDPCVKELYGHLKPLYPWRYTMLGHLCFKSPIGTCRVPMPPSSHLSRLFPGPLPCLSDLPTVDHPFPSISQFFAP